MPPHSEFSDDCLLLGSSGGKTEGNDGTEELARSFRLTGAPLLEERGRSNKYGGTIPFPCFPTSAPLSGAPLTSVAVLGRVVFDRGRWLPYVDSLNAPDIDVCGRRPGPTLAP
jgi:hypothetical protein